MAVDELFPARHRRILGKATPGPRPQSSSTVTLAEVLVAVWPGCSVPMSANHLPNACHGSPQSSGQIRSSA